SRGAAFVRRRNTRCGRRGPRTRRARRPLELALKLTVLTGADVRRLVPMPDAIDAMAEAFAQLASGSAHIPLRTHVETEGGLALFMPGYLPDSGALGSKVVSV